MLYYLAIDEKLEGGELGAPVGRGSRGKGIEGGMFVGEGREVGKYKELFRKKEMKLEGRANRDNFKGYLA